MPGLFNNGLGFRARGPRAELLAGYASAATLHDWQIAKVKGAWTLIAGADNVNPFLIKSRLRFAAPRGYGAGGYWYWPIVGAVTVTGRSLTATLGKPE